MFTRYVMKIIWSTIIAMLEEALKKLYLEVKKNIEENQQRAEAMRNAQNGKTGTSEEVRKNVEIKSEEPMFASERERGFKVEKTLRNDNNSYTFSSGTDSQSKLFNDGMVKFILAAISAAILVSVTLLINS